MKLLKLLALLAAALLVSTSSYTVGEGSWECLWGTGCTGGDDWDTNDDGFVDPEYNFYMMNWTTYKAGVEADEGNCLFKSYAANSTVSCITNGGQTTSGYPFLNGIYIDSCVVHWTDSDPAAGPFAAGDKVVLQLITVNKADNLIDEDFTNKFTIADSTDTCGVDPNCIDSLTDQGSWTVEDSSSLDNGVVSVRIHTDTTDPDTNIDMRVTVSCLAADIL